MATFKIVLRPSSLGDNYQGALSLRVIYKRKPKTLSLSCRLFPWEWDGETQEIVSAGADAGREKYLSEARGQLAACKEKVRGVIRRLEEKRSYSSADVIRLYKSAADEGMLSSLADYLAEELKENGQWRTSRAYHTVTRRLKKFLRGKDIAPEGITATLMRRFVAYLKAEGLKPNSICFYVCNLRSIYKKAVALGLIPRDGENPFADLSVAPAETEKRGLTADCVKRLQDLQIKEEVEGQIANARTRSYARALRRALKFFLFCIYAHGMCFVDMLHLKKSDIRNGELRYNRKKTGGQIVVPVNELMQEIIDGFAGEMKDSPYLFPANRGTNGGNPEWYNTVLHGQNRHLKVLARLTGLNINLTAHMARHSWASICKSEMVSTAVICEGLGHSSEKMTRKYLACFNTAVMRNAGMSVINAIFRPTAHKQGAHPG